MTVGAAFVILELEPAELSSMATTRSRRASRRFLPPVQAGAKTEPQSLFTSALFAEGRWHAIRSDLEMRGWSPVQVEQIHTELRQGWPLTYAVRQVAMRMGTCPMRSRFLG